MLYWPSHRLLMRLLILLSLLLIQTGVCAKNEAVLPVTQAYQLKTEVSKPGLLKLHWTIAPHYFLYRERIKFSAGRGVTLGSARLPKGEKHVDPFLGVTWIYHHSIDALLPYTIAPGTTRLRLSVRYQGCREVKPKLCYPPHTRQINLPLSGEMTPQANTPGTKARPTLAAALGLTDKAIPGSFNTGTATLTPEQAFHFAALAQDAHHLLLRWTMPKGYYLYRDKIKLQLKNAHGLHLVAPHWPPGGMHRDAHHGQSIVYFKQLELPIHIEGDLTRPKPYDLEVDFQGCQDGGLCYPLMERLVAVQANHSAQVKAIHLAASTPGNKIPARQAKVRHSGVSPLHFRLLGGVLLLAFLGGLLLNLMPCVLPVLSIKLVSLLESGERPKHRHHHALAYTAGIMFSFTVIGLAIITLRAGGHALGWGAQLQQPLLVAILACVIFALGLSMSGVVQFGNSLGNVGSTLVRHGGIRSDFFTGVLAVVVASPCTAPFMGSALTYAFTAPRLNALLVFLMLGLGLASPFLMIGFIPFLARWVPRPGRWMETLKQVLAFPMYLTVVWLVWIVTHQRGADAMALLLIAMVLLALTLWWFERSRTQGLIKRAWVLPPALLVFISLYTLGNITAPTRTVQTTDGSTPYNPKQLATLREAGTPVLVDITADWCITCKVNEREVLGTDSFRALLKRTGTVYMKGDWTNVDSAITTFLQHYQSPGVPLYVVFPKGGGAGQKLPTVLTFNLMKHALDQHP